MATMTTAYKRKKKKFTRGNTPKQIDKKKKRATENWSDYHRRSIILANIATARIKSARMQSECMIVVLWL